MSNLFLAIHLATEASRITLRKYFRIESQKGIHIMEYALLGVLIAIALIGSIQAVSDALLDLYLNITNAFY